MFQGCILFLILFLIGICSSLTNHSGIIRSFLLMFSKWFLLPECFYIDALWTSSLKISHLRLFSILSLCFYSINFLNQNYLFNKNTIDKWRVKFVLFAILKKVLIIFTTNINNANRALFNEVWNVTIRLKIIYRISEKFIMKKGKVLLAKSNLNQRNRKNYRKIYK